MILGSIAKLIIPRVLVPLFVWVGKFYPYKICLMRTDRLGHLSSNTHLFFIRQKKGLIQDINYYLIAPSRNSSKVANKSLFMLYIEYSKSLHNVNLLCSNILYFFFDYSQQFFKNKEIFSKLDYKSRETEFALGVQTVSFTNKQKSFGTEILSQMNVKTNDKLVSIFSRDPSFLKSQDIDKDWSYHNYRDTNIKSYLKAIKYLIKEGYTVVRIGSEYSKSLGYINDKYIEYNLSEYKSSFMDLYIPYVSTFIIGCKSGATDLSLLFNTPILITDLTPFVEAALGKNDLFIQKKIVDLKGNIVPFKELVSNEKYYTYDGNKMHSLYGLKYIENTEDEILEATIEMHNKMTDNFILEDAKIDLLSRYHNEYCNKNRFSSEFVPISVNWLEKNYGLYLDN